jgi:hypothetical protein
MKIASLPSSVSERKKIFSVFELSQEILLFFISYGITFSVKISDEELLLFACEEGDLLTAKYLVECKGL